MPGTEAELPGLGERRAVEVGEQRGRGLVIGDVRTGIDVAIADPVLERDAPLPAGAACGGAGERVIVAAEFARHRIGSVAGQPGGPVLEPRAHHLLDQHAAEARTVDEQVAFDP